MSHERMNFIEHNANKISAVNSIKFLGVIIDSSLTWKEHTDHINSKLNSLGYMARSLRPVLGQKIILKIYFSYVHSVLNYGIMFWRTSPHSRPIFITQKRIVRCIMKAKPKDSCRELFKINTKQAAYGSKKFKHLLKAFLISNSFYSVEEYLNFN
jgi:hypothetical protein